MLGLLTEARAPYSMPASSPGEAWVENGLRIKQRSPFPYTVVAELCNDDVGYEPTFEGFRELGYEPAEPAEAMKAAFRAALAGCVAQVRGEGKAT